MKFMKLLNNARNKSARDKGALIVMGNVVFITDPVGHHICKAVATKNDSKKNGRKIKTNIFFFKIKFH